MHLKRIFNPIENLRIRQGRRMEVYLYPDSLEKQQNHQSFQQMALRRQQKRREVENRLKRIGVNHNLLILHPLRLSIISIPIAWQRAWKAQASAKGKRLQS